MLTGEGTFVARNNQIIFKLQVNEKVKLPSIRAWRELPSEGNLDLISIHQSPDEPFQDFATHLL